jgi:hypothetical protein
VLSVVATSENRVAKKISFKKDFSESTKLEKNILHSMPDNKAFALSWVDWPKALPRHIKQKQRIKAFFCILIIDYTIKTITALIASFSD